MKLDKIVAEFAGNMQKRGRRRSTINVYLNRIEKFFSFIKKDDPSTVNESDILNFTYMMKDEGYKSSTTSLYITSVKSLFAYLEKKYGLVNIASEWSSERRTRNIPEILSKEEVVSMIMAAGKMTELELRNAAIICLLADTGIRVGELVKLKIGNVTARDDQYTLTIPDMKTGMRQVPFSYLKPGRLIAEIWTAYWYYCRTSGRRRGDLLFQRTGRYWIKKNNKTLPGKEMACGTGALSKQSVDRIIKKLAKKANITRSVSAHDFRHFYATYLAINNERLEIIQARLGHTNISNTMIYVHLADIVKSGSSANNPLADIASQTTGFVTAHKAVLKMGGKR